MRLLMFHGGPPLDGARWTSERRNARKIIPFTRSHVKSSTYLPADRLKTRD